MFTNTAGCRGRIGYTNVAQFFQNAIEYVIYLEHCLLLTGQNMVKSKLRKYLLCTSVSIIVQRHK